MIVLIAFGLALVLTGAARVIGTAASIVDRPRDSLKIHEQPVSVLGGAAVVAASLLALVISQTWIPAALLAAILICLAIGIADDLRPLPVWARVGSQVAAGGLLILSIPDRSVVMLIAAFAIALACINAVNLVDGQDGLAGGLGAIAALGLSGLTSSQNPAFALLGLALAGSLCGFLIWNRPPAKVFLGDGGAYSVGLILAALAVNVVAEAGLKGLLAAGLCLSVFGFDLVMTVVRRLVFREKLGAGDRGHSYDVLARRLGRGKTTLVFWFLGGLSAALSLIVMRTSIEVGLAIGVAVSLLGIFVVLRLLAGRELSRA